MTCFSNSPDWAAAQPLTTETVTRRCVLVHQSSVHADIALVKRVGGRPGTSFREGFSATDRTSRFHLQDSKLSVDTYGDVPK